MHGCSTSIQQPSHRTTTSTKYLNASVTALQTTGQSYEAYLRNISAKLASWFWKTPSLPSATTTSSHTSPDSFTMSDPRSQPTTSNLSISSPPTQPAGPQLTPQFCFNTRVLQDFLRISRSQLDDTISTSLNSLLTPSTTNVFTPSSTRSPTHNRNPRAPIPKSTCDKFLNEILFPSWSNRDKVLHYCSNVASSPDPDDPDIIAIELEKTKLADRKVDERLDPYSGRFFPNKQPRAEKLSALLQNELRVEWIIRDRTWRILEDRCDLKYQPGGWGDAMSNWNDMDGK